MFIWKGTANGEFFSNPKNLPTRIISSVIVNTSGGAVNVYGYVIDENDHSVPIMNYPKTLSAGESIVSTTSIGMNKNDRVRLVTNGVVGYYFTFTNSIFEGETLA